MAFKKPTIEEVAAYIKEIGANIDPEYYWLYNESIGWTVGKSNKPMVNWKANVQVWKRNNYGNRQQQNATQKQEFSNDNY